MSKYEPLHRHLRLSHGKLELGFPDLEKILGFTLPRSARRYPAWWSNNEGSHVQAKAWLSAGYETSDVRIADERVTFVQTQRGGFGEMKQSKFGDEPQSHTAAPPEVEKKPYRHPAFGALKGMITLLPDVDYTEPADPDWGKVYEE